MRKFLSGYLRGLPHIARFRMELMKYKTMEPIFERLDLLAETTVFKDLVTAS
jgi:hypothetical protein